MAIIFLLGWLARRHTKKTLGGEMHREWIQPARSLRARAERMERELERMLGERILLAARIKKLETLEALAYKIQAAHLVHPDYVRTYGPCLCQICEFLRGERKT